jgi:hypothetical protein
MIAGVPGRQTSTKRLVTFNAEKGRSGAKTNIGLRPGAVLSAGFVL